MKKIEIGITELEATTILEALQTVKDIKLEGIRMLGNLSPELHEYYNKIDALYTDLSKKINREYYK
jgi:hypothetical protein